MGAIGGRLADWTILTSDNPRTEPPEQILDEIEAALREKGFLADFLSYEQEEVEK